MEFTGTYLIPATPQAVWEGLNDHDVLRRSIPGCKGLERTGDNEFTATILARVGPVAATFKGKVELADLDPPHGYTLRGRGQGGPAGFAKGEARVSLAPEEGQTRLTYTAAVDIGGKLASVGGRLIQGVARKNADDFFSAFSRVLTGEAVPEAMAAPGEAATPTGLRPVAVAAAGHLPMIDRVAWLLVGLAMGVGLSFLVE